LQHVSEKNGLANGVAESLVESVPHAWLRLDLALLHQCLVGATSPTVLDHGPLCGCDLHRCLILALPLWRSLCGLIMVGDRSAKEVGGWLQTKREKKKFL